MSSPLVSIIIVNLDGQNVLNKCLISLKDIFYNNTEILLVDNASQDSSIEIAKKLIPSIIVIKLEKNLGYAKPNNIGAKKANGKYLLFLNNDTFVEPNFLDELVQVIENDSTISICQSMLLKPNGEIDSSGDFIDKLGVAYNSKTKTNQIREIFSARGASMLVKKEHFEKISGFDETFFAFFEDVDLSWRTWIINQRVVLVPTSIVYHIGSTTSKKLLNEIKFHSTKNQLIMKITNFETSLAIKNIFSFFILYGFREIRIWFDYKLFNKTNLHSTKYENTIAEKPNFKIICKSIFWIIRNIKYLQKKHHQIESTRILKTQNLIEKQLISDNIQ